MLKKPDQKLALELVIFIIGREGKCVIELLPVMGIFCKHRVSKLELIGIV